jgi:arylsulfatase A-like enzyme
MKLFLSSFFLLAVSCFGASQKPNILFIAVDDLKPLTAAYGDQHAITPNIDRISKHGTTFLNNQCNWAVCGPSRVSIMTSLMPETTGVMGFKPMRAILPDLITLPQHLRAHGYETTGVGKILDFRTVDKQYDERSWSIPFDPIKQGTHKNKGPKKAASIYTGPLEKNKDYMVAQAGIKHLRQLAKKDKPFFLGVGFHKPHLPLIAPKKYWDFYQREQFSIHPFQEAARGADASMLKKPDEMKGYTKINQNELPEALQLETIHGYYACVSFVDDLVGQLLDELDTLGIADNTIIVFWGDHGFHLGDHGLWAKHTNIEQSARAPLIIAAPQLHVKNQSTKSPSQFLDVFPTLCELVDISAPSAVEGKSLVPILKDASAKIHDGVVTLKGSSCYAYRTERYRYVESYNKSSEVTSRLLFDYQKDPMETENLAANPEYTALVKKLAASMRAEVKGCKHLKN